jgi:hypothetical protein
MKKLQMITVTVYIGALRPQGYVSNVEGKRAMQTSACQAY